MSSELENGNHENTGAIANIEGGNPDYTGTKEQAEIVLPPAKSVFVDPAQKRRAKIKKLEAQLQREIARDSKATRKERDGQLFIWGAMVEGVYRDGDAQERDLLRQWANRKLTDQRHLQRAENGFARIEGEAADKADA